jgi:hypothetical protein
MYYHIIYHTDYLISFIISHHIPYIRRRQLKQEVDIRREEFFIEEQTTDAVGGLTTDLRAAIDQLWCVISYS